MGLLETVGTNLEVAAITTEQKLKATQAEQARRTAYLNEQHRLGEPLREKAVALIDKVQALIPYEELVEVRGLFFKRARTEKEIERMKAEKLGISAYGFLDGDPRYMITIMQDIPTEPGIYHNGSLLFNFSDYYYSRVGTRNQVGMLEDLILDEQSAAEMSSYLDQLNERVQWQKATHVDLRVHGAIARGPASFKEHILPEARGDLFLEQFINPTPEQA